MKKFLFICTAILLSMSSCVKDQQQENPTGPTEPWNPWNFSTLTKTDLDISYQNMGGIAAPVYFEIYDTCPVQTTANGASYVRVEGLEPLFSGITAADGTFKGTAELPSYLETVYVYTPAFYALTLIQARIEGKTLIASDYVADAPEQAAATRASYESDVVTKDNWKTYLGTYDSTYGRINYKYTGTELKAKNYAALYTTHSKVINTNKSCPEEYRSSKDLYINEDAEVAVTFLGSNTCWNCSMGYYFYKDGEKPKSLKDIDVIMIFPNTQDGQWSNNQSLSRKYKGVDRGTTVQLKFFTDMKDAKTGTNAFKAGYRIGFVLACNAWGNQLPGFGGAKGYRAATSEGLSVNDNGVAFTGARTAVYRYINASKDTNSILFSFEDYTTDDNFSDIVFTLVSSPIEAVTDVPEIEEDDKTQTAKHSKGIYSFEDLWPSRGDYDMNDVLVKHNYEKTFNEKGIHEESFIFKTFRNTTTGLENGLAITLSGAATSAELSFSVMGTTPNAEYTAAQFRREGNVILITDNVKQGAGSHYKLTAKYAAPVQNGGSAQAFIYRPQSSGKLWELHLPLEAPTSMADMSFFGKADDCSDPAKGLYYVRKQLYPFAFFLAGANESDLAPLFDTKNEKTPIDELYPDYPKWAASQGQTNKDWYKK